MTQATSLIRARNAIYCAFFLNGFIIGHWAPKIPVMVERLGITESTLGQMIILFGVGAVIALVVGAALVVHFGARSVVRWTSVLLSPSLIFLTVTPTPLTAALAMLWLGMFLGAMDNAMNASGVMVEVELKKPVMSSYHGFWSLGGVAGGLTGGALISWMGEMGHAVLVSTIVLGLAVWAWPRYLADSPTANTAQKSSIGAFLRAMPHQPGIYILGIATMLMFAPEGTVIDWSALFLRNEMDAPVLVSGYAVAAFSATMALMRLRGDKLRQHFGDFKTFVAGAFVAALGLFIAGIADTVAIACAGFFICGLGMANTVPILFSAAGRYPGLKPSVGIAVITVFGYAGLLFIPALVGDVAEAYSLGMVFAGWGAILSVIAFMSLMFPTLFAKPEKHDPSKQSV